jgi:hypothetical protein
MINVQFLMTGGVQPYFTADLTVGQWAETIVGVLSNPGGRQHINLAHFEPGRLLVQDALMNPIVFTAIEDPGPVYLEMTVLNQGAGDLSVEVAGADTLRLVPGQTATISYNRNGPMTVTR